jgi:hypothetical protein
MNLAENRSARSHAHGRRHPAQTGGYDFDAAVGALAALP